MEHWTPYFIALAALAFVVQAAAVLAIYLQVRRTSEKVERILGDFHAQCTPILSRLQLLVEDISPRITGIVSDAAELTRLARGQAHKVDRVFTELMERLRLQLIHVDHILTGAMETVEVAGSYLRSTVWQPVAKVSAVVRGIQTGLDFLRVARRRGARAEAHAEPQQQDEGMFI